MTFKCPSFFLCSEWWCIWGRPAVWEVCVDSHRANCLPHDRWRAFNGRNPPKTRPAGPPHDVPGAFLMLNIRAYFAHYWKRKLKHRRFFIFPFVCDSITCLQEDCCVDNFVSVALIHISLVAISRRLRYNWRAVIVWHWVLKRRELLADFSTFTKTHFVSVFLRQSSVL